MIYHLSIDRSILLSSSIYQYLSLIWPHEFPFFSMAYNFSLSLIILALKLPLIWPVGIRSCWQQCSYEMLQNFFNLFLHFWYKNMFQFLSVPSPSHRLDEPFLWEALDPLLVKSIKHQGVGLRGAHYRQVSLLLGKGTFLDIHKTEGCSFRARVWRPEEGVTLLLTTAALLGHQWSGEF